MLSSSIYFPFARLDDDNILCSSVVHLMLLYSGKECCCFSVCNVLPFNVFLSPVELCFQPIFFGSFFVVVSFFFTVRMYSIHKCTVPYTELHDCNTIVCTYHQHKYIHTSLNWPPIVHLESHACVNNNNNLFFDSSMPHLLFEIRLHQYNITQIWLIWIIFCFTPFRSLIADVIWWLGHAHYLLDIDTLQCPCI